MKFLVSNAVAHAEHAGAIQVSSGGLKGISKGERRFMETLRAPWSCYSGVAGLRGVSGYIRGFHGVSTAF